MVCGNGIVDPNSHDADRGDRKGAGTGLGSADWKGTDTLLIAQLEGVSC